MTLLAGRGAEEGLSINRRGIRPQAGSGHGETPLGREEENYLNLDYQ